MQRLGILGGTFDPVHLGHLASARSTCEAFKLDRILLILSARPPHKPDTVPASVHHRLSMLDLATAGDPRLEVSAIEARREGPSYTYETLREIHRLCPKSELYLVLGMDAYQEIESWHRPGELLELTHIVVTSRPGHGAPPEPPLPPVAARESCCYDPHIGGYLHKTGHRFVVHPLSGVEASASDIRRRIREGRPFAHLTGQTVADYIRTHHLYGPEDR